MNNVKKIVATMEGNTQKNFNIEGTFEYYDTKDWIQNWNDEDEPLEDVLIEKLKVGKDKLKKVWEGVEPVKLKNTPDQPIRNIEITKSNLGVRSIKTEDFTKLLETAIQTSRQRIIDKYTGGGQHTFSIQGKYKSSCGIIALDTFVIDGTEFKNNGDIKKFIAGKIGECDMNGGKRKTRRYKRKRPRFSKKAK